jgi:hypothetical protein
LAVPVLRYSFGIINWHQEEIKRLDKNKGKCRQSVDSVTQEETLIVYIFIEKREEED